MPSNWLYIDTNFPAFTGEENVKEQVSTIQNYLYMLVEQMRYSLRNLDAQNFNETGLNEIGAMITDPVYARIEDDEENILWLSVTAADLTSRMSAADGRISQLQQTVDGFGFAVTNGEDYSLLSLTSNGIVMASATIRFTGTVTFTDLRTAGATTINGGNITTGTVRGITLQGNEIIGGTVTGATLRSVSGSDNGLEIYYGAVSNYLLVGGIRFDDRGAGTASEARYRMFIYTNSGYADWAMKLESAGGMSLESGTNLYMRAGTVLNLNGSQVIVNGWEFRSSGIYYSGRQIVSTTPAAE